MNYKSNLGKLVFSERQSCFVKALIQDTITLILELMVSTGSWWFLVFSGSSWWWNQVVTGGS